MSLQQLNIKIGERILVIIEMMIIINKIFCW
jgi:hypothetical protein